MKCIDRIVYAWKINKIAFYNKNGTTLELHQNLIILQMNLMVGFNVPKENLPFDDIDNYTWA